MFLPAGRVLLQDSRFSSVPARLGEGAPATHLQPRSAVRGAGGNEAGRAGPGGARGGQAGASSKLSLGMRIALWRKGCGVHRSGKLRRF